MRAGASGAARHECRCGSAGDRGAGGAREIAGDRSVPLLDPASAEAGRRIIQRPVRAVVEAALEPDRRVRSDARLDTAAVGDLWVGPSCCGVRRLIHIGVSRSASPHVGTRVCLGVAERHHRRQPVADKAAICDEVGELTFTVSSEARIRGEGRSRVQPVAAA